MRFAKLLMQERHPGAGWWGERLAAALAIAGVLAVTSIGSHVRTSPDAGSDFKTVYASGKCFLQGLPAYSFRSLAGVFRNSGVVLPERWYAHAPIYPPFTFAVLAPVIALPMVAAVYVWMALSALALLGASLAMMGRAEREFGLQRGSRLVLLILVAASPLVSFGLQVGNLSVAAAALCIVVIACTDVASPGWLAVALTVSLLLKPHVAVWILLAMCVSRNRLDRAVGLRALGFFAGALLCIGALFSFHHPLGLQMHSFSAMVRSELASGSMSPGNRESLPGAAEITSLQSLFGFFTLRPASTPFLWSALTAALAALLWVSRSRGNDGGENRLELLGAWSTFGMLVTYHRAHDGILLLLLLPWMLLRWHRRLFDSVAGAVLLLFVADGCSVEGTALRALSSEHGLAGVSHLLLFRQAPLATLALFLLLLSRLILRTRGARMRVPVLLPAGATKHARKLVWSSQP